MIKYLIIYILFSMVVSIYPQVKYARKKLEKDEKKQGNQANNALKQEIILGVFFTILAPLWLPFVLLIRFSDLLFPVKRFLKRSMDRFFFPDDQMIVLSFDQALDQSVEKLKNQPFKTRAKEILSLADQFKSSKGNEEVKSLIYKICSSVVQFTGWHKYSEHSDDVVYDRINHDKIVQTMEKLSKTKNYLAMQFLILMTHYNGDCDLIIKDALKILGRYNDPMVENHLKNLIGTVNHMDIISVAKNILAELESKEKWGG